MTATEAIATQERDYIPPNRDDSFRVYVNVIVTTAALSVLKADAGAVSLEDGTLEKAEVVPVPYVRFRKQLSTAAAAPIPSTFDPPETIASERESTVFVVNAARLGEFLENFELDNAGANKFA